MTTMDLKNKVTERLLHLCYNCSDAHLCDTEEQCLECFAEHCQDVEETEDIELRELFRLYAL